MLISPFLLPFGQSAIIKTRPRISGHSQRANSINNGQNVATRSSNLRKKAMAGRTVGNTATVISDHPAIKRFPHDGWCDLQFAKMLEKGSAVLLEHIPLPFNPITEVDSTYKLPFKQAALFELTIGKGQALICTLTLEVNCLAAVYMNRILLEHIATSNFRLTGGNAINIIIPRE